MAKRTFKFDGSRGRYPKPDFEVVSSLSNAAAIKVLGGFDGDSFEAKCAFEIHKDLHGFGGKANMIAWGFRLAEEKSTPAERLSETIRKLVKCRKPLTGEVDGEPFKVAQCGENSRYCGDYNITDGGPFRSNRFYGRAKPDGTWTPTQVTPKSVIAKLTE